MNADDFEKAEKELRERMTAFAASFFARGFVVGGAGNMSARLPDGTLLATPTGAGFGRLDPERLAKINMDGSLVSGDAPTKEVVFHRALFRARPDCGAVVHLHSTHLTALSCLEGLNAEDVLRPFTPYYVMKVGRLRLIPYYRPGHPRLGEELGAHAGAEGGAFPAFLLANHGPVVMGRTLEEAVNAAEELEETARLYFVLAGSRVRYLTDGEIEELRKG